MNKIAWRSRAVLRERSAIRTHRILLIEDPEWTGRDLKKMLADCGFPCDLGAACSATYDVAVATLSQPDQAQPLHSRCLASPTTHFIVCCASQEIRERVHLWQADNLSLLEPSQHSALVPMVELARKNQRMNRQVQTQFMARLDHELRSPLSGILGSARLVLNTQLSPTQREYLEGVFTYGESLMTRLSEVSEFSRLESGCLEISPLAVCLRHCLNDVIQHLNRGLELDLRVSAEAPEHVLLDPRRLHQVLAHLVAGGRDKVVVEVGVKGSELHFRIQPAKVAAGVAGKLCLGLIERMGGSYWVEDRAFHLTLPLVATAPIDSPRVSLTAYPSEAWSLSRRPGRPGPPLRILVADDNEVSQAMAVLVLEEQGHEVGLAADGEAVLALLGEQSFDLVLMDVQMPKLDGYLTTRAIREQERGTSRHLSIIAVTAHGREGDAEICLAAGMDGFVAKPIHEDELFEVMQRVLGWSDELVIEPGQKMLNREALQRRLGGREDHLHRVIGQFLEMLPRQLDEVYQCFSRGDQEALSAALHRLKCSALAFESPRVLEPISRLEWAARRPLGLAESGAVLANLRCELEQLTRELIELDTSLAQGDSIARLPLPSNWPGMDRPLRVLLAEDNPINQTLVLTLLEEHSCQISVVENGQAAVDACAAAPFDVILMDIQMPILDGLEAMTLIRQREGRTGVYTPIVVLTASQREGDGGHFLAAGASHYLCKPIQEDDLLKVLHEVVVDHGVTPALPLTETTEVLDVAALGERLQYKLERLARLTQVFNQVLPGHLADLSKAVVSGRGKELEGSARRFRATLRTIEARSTMVLAQQLEAMGREGRLEGTEEIIQHVSLESEQIRATLEQLMAEATILAQL